MDKIIIETDGDDLESWDYFSCFFLSFGVSMLIYGILIGIYSLLRLL